MKVSQLILELESLMKEHGDVEVLMEDSPIDNVDFFERSEQYAPVIRLE